MSFIVYLRRFPWLLGVLLAPFLILILRPHPSPAAGKLRVTFLDVGQGNCILVETPQRQAMLIDGGGSSNTSVVDKSNTGLRTVVPYLHYRGISHLAVVVLTQPQGDHCGGLTAVLREETVGAVLDGTVDAPSSADYRMFRQEIQQHHIPYEQAVRGMHLLLGGGVSADILSPPAGGVASLAAAPPDAAIDNSSVILRLNYGHTHFLLTSDAEADAENSLLASGLPLSANVLQAGHNGSALATSDPFLARVHPQFAAISCGRHLAFPDPSPITLARLAAHHVQIYCTAWNGAIIFLSDGKNVSVYPYKPSSRHSAT